MGIGAAIGAVSGFYQGVGSQTAKALCGGKMDWGAVGESTAAGAIGGAIIGAAAGAFTGDPSAAIAAGIIGAGAGYVGGFGAGLLF
jgi:hypothetical protein